VALISYAFKVLGALHSDNRENGVKPLQPSATVRQTCCTIFATESKAKAFGKAYSNKGMKPSRETCQISAMSYSSEGRNGRTFNRRYFFCVNQV